MDRKLSNVDFSYLIGQTVEGVNTEKDENFGIAFEAGFLMIECPWRIKISNIVKIGYSDILHSKGKYRYKDVEKIVMGKRILNIVHFEQVSDLIVEFEDGLSLELFHDSTYFEGWQLSTDNGLLLVSLPGGEYCEF